LADGSCIRLRPERANHVWSYDFVEDRTHDGRKFSLLNVIDEFTHECLAIRVGRRLRAADVIDVLADLFLLRGVPGFILVLTPGSGPAGSQVFRGTGPQRGVMPLKQKTP
jgi:transposase InsO family protein